MNGEHGTNQINQRFSAAASALVIATVWLHSSPGNVKSVAKQPDKTEFSVTNRFYAELKNNKLKK